MSHKLQTQHVDYPIDLPIMIGFEIFIRHHLSPLADLCLKLTRAKGNYRLFHYFLTIQIQAVESGTSGV
jgi:hypothetical protein